MWSRDGDIRWVCPEVLCNELERYEAHNFCLVTYGFAGGEGAKVLWEQTLPLTESHLTLQVIPRGGESNADSNTDSPPAP